MSGNWGIYTQITSVHVAESLSLQHPLSFPSHPHTWLSRGRIVTHHNRWQPLHIACHSLWKWSTFKSIVTALSQDFEIHIASVVGGKSVGNGTHHMHMLKRVTNKNLVWDPPHDSTTNLAHKSVEESSHVFATMTKFRDGVIMNLFYMLPGLA